ncbi:hypothetical protein [Streptomyces afghaniensis 772] [Streptomyces afghaniensis]|nr:hypothetical protein [Streptomyces afghaniensis]
MTPGTADRPLMPIEDFADLAEVAPNTVVVYSEPKDGRYQQAAAHPLGTPVELPAPVGFTLDTEELKDYAD